jgi:type VI protein secretion system component Hcp
MCINAQSQEVYIKLTNSSGQIIKGDAVSKGYERWIPALMTTSSSEKSNTQFSFTINSSGTTADLKRALTKRELLQNGEVVVLKSRGFDMKQVLLYSIKMEQIMVVNCDEIIGNDGAMITSVTLEATRIGWTYYNTNKFGVQSITNKYGYDAETGGEWKNF